MAQRIKFNAKAQAERVLQGVMKRNNYSVDVRDQLADALEAIVIDAFKDAGMAAVNTSDK